MVALNPSDRPETSPINNPFIVSLQSESGQKESGVLGGVDEDVTRFTPG